MVKSLKEKIAESMYLPDNTKCFIFKDVEEAVLRYIEYLESLLFSEEELEEEYEMYESHMYERDEVEELFKLNHNARIESHLKKFKEIFSNSVHVTTEAKNISADLDCLKSL